jgi:methyl-accepting chemotaxis protein
VEETSAASAAMQEQAARLAQAVAVFRLDTAAAACAAPVVARAAPARPAPARPTAKGAAPRTRIAAATPAASDREAF